MPGRFVMLPPMMCYGPPIIYAVYPPPTVAFAPWIQPLSMQPLFALPPQMGMAPTMTCASAASPSSSNCSAYEPSTALGGSDKDDEPASSSSSTPGMVRDAHGAPVVARVIHGTTYFSTTDDEAVDCGQQREAEEGRRREKEMAIPEPLRAFLLHGEVDASAPTDYVSTVARGMARVHLLRHFGLV